MSVRVEQADRDAAASFECPEEPRDGRYATFTDEEGAELHAIGRAAGKVEGRKEAGAMLRGSYETLRDVYTIDTSLAEVQRTVKSLIDLIDPPRLGISNKDWVVKG